MYFQENLQLLKESAIGTHARYDRSSLTRSRAAARGNCSLRPLNATTTAAMPTETHRSCNNAAPTRYLAAFHLEVLLYH